MGSGIAVQFKRRYPEMYYKYRDMCHGAFLKPGMVYPWLDIEDDGTKLWVYNIASQNEPGNNAKLTYLEAGLQYVKFHMRERGVKHLALPRIGAGIGGLRYDDVYTTILGVFAALPDLHVTVVSLPEA
jgi:O-acetyl-ADP-ribose deacetylase (regulator of RNase III)